MNKRNAGKLSQEMVNILIENLILMETVSNPSLVAIGDFDEQFRNHINEPSYVVQYGEQYTGISASAKL